MKKLNLLVAGLVCFATLSCSDDDKTSEVDNTNVTAVEDAMQTGSWKITSFIEEGNDETAHFTGYNFTFSENGTLRAANGTTTINGTWSVTHSDDSSDDDDSSSHDVDFNIAFANPAEFTELNDDWDILERNGNTLKLIDVSGGNGGTDYLTFTKN